MGRNVLLHTVHVVKRHRRIKGWRLTLCGRHVSPSVHHQLRVSGLTNYNTPLAVSAAKADRTDPSKRCQRCWQIQVKEQLWRV